LLNAFELFIKRLYIFFSVLDIVGLGKTLKTSIDLVIDSNHHRYPRNQRKNKLQKRPEREIKFKVSIEYLNIL